MRDLLRRWLVENAVLKLVALVLAVTLFILVSGEKVTERSVRVGVAYIRPSDRVLVSEVPDSVEVWLRGSWTRIKRLDPADVPAIVVDLTKRNEGEITIDAADIRVPAGLSVVSIRPSKILVNFEHAKKVPVVPELVGNIADGYIVERVAVDPVALSVRGPERLLAGVNDARTLPISVAGKRAPFRVEVELAPLPAGVVAEEDAVTVEIQIAEEMATRTLPAVRVTPQLPPGGPRAPAADLAPATVSIVLRGGRNAMRQIADDKIGAVVELHLSDYAPAATRLAPVIVTGVPAGVAVEVHPREIFVSSHAPGGARQP